MKHYLLLAVLFITGTAISQDNSIKTTFADSGAIHQAIDDNSEILDQFERNENCIVLGYLGNNFYKVSYNEVVGYVGDEYLMVNGQMMDLFNTYEAQGMSSTSSEQGNAGTKNVTRFENESNRVQSLKEKEAALEEKYNKLKLKIEARKAKELLKEQDALIAKANEAAKQQVLLSNEQRRLDQIRINDSIARVNERMRIATLYKNEQQRKRALFVADSIAKAEKALKYQKRLAEKKAKALEKQNTQKALAAKEKKRLAEEAKAKALETETLANALEKAKKEIEALKKQQSQSAATVKNTTKSLCEYQFRESTGEENGFKIRTEAYDIAKNVNVQLDKKGLKTNVIFSVSKNIGCASNKPNERSSVKITLENHKVISFYHSGSIICDAFFFKSSMSNSKISALKTSPIKSIELKGTKEALTLTQIANKNYFIDMLSCVE